MTIESGAAAESVNQTQPFPGIKALVCDDDELNQRIMQRLLSKYGVVAETAGNGREGLDMIVAQAFDIVFVDLQMPVMDGQEMARLVRADASPRIARTLLVAVTGAAHYFQDKTLAETGFDDYIVKPITPHLILESLKRAFPQD